MKKTLLLLFAAFVTLVTNAQTKVEIDGIWYNLVSKAKQAEVRSSDGTKYSGSITIPATVTYDGVAYNVTSIGDAAFRDCSSLTAITIPEGVTSIEDYTFFGCSSLTSINIPERVTSIGSYAFWDCSSLTAINIPEGVTSIGVGAFSDCSSLTAITIPEGVTSIADYAFSGCSSLKTVINYSDLPLQRGSYVYGYVAHYADRVINVDKFINDFAFKTKDGVHYLTGYIGDKTELTLPADYKGENYQIGDYVFEYCRSLTAITLPEGVTSIGDLAFYQCSSLTTITIPEGVTSIGDQAFAWCESLTSITIPESVTSIGRAAFNICSSLASINIPDGVTSIGEYTFSGCSSLTAITIPENSRLTRIESKAFYECSNLPSITIPEGVTYIGIEAFYQCSSLTSITIPEGVTYIESKAFYNCRSLKTVINYSDLEIQKLKSSYGYVAYYADRVINVDKFINDFAFKTKDGVHYLTAYIGDDTELTLPNDFEGENYQIGDYAFYKCSSLTSITLPKDVTSIGDYAFYCCSSLTSITLPEGVTSIGKEAFDGCRITSITIPKGVASIGDYAFYCCFNLKTVINYSNLNIQTDNKSNGYVAYYADRVIDVDKLIDGYAFKTKDGVHYLTGYIGDDTELTLPNDYEGENYQIGKRAFYKCSNLTSITSKASTPPTIGDPDTFYSVDKSIPVYVPAGSVDAYKAAPYWSDFTNIIGMEMSIENTEIKNEESTIIFDLHGRRVENPTKGGIYIVNGRKVVIND